MEQLKRRDRKLIRKGHIFEYYEDTLELPDGKEALYDFILHIHLHLNAVLMAVILLYNKFLSFHYNMLQ